MCRAQVGVQQKVLVSCRVTKKSDQQPRRSARLALLHDSSLQGSDQCVPPRPLRKKIKLHIEQERRQPDVKTEHTIEMERENEEVR